MSPFTANFRLPGNRKARAKRARLAGRTGITLSVVLTATLLPVQAWAAPPGDRTGVTLPGLQEDLKAILDQGAAAQLMDWAPPTGTLPSGYEANAKTPPVAASASVPLSGDQPVQVGSLPVRLGKATGSSTSPSGVWTAAIESRAVTEGAGIDGALIKVTPPADSSTAIDVHLDYAQFKDIYGTEWASRLKFRQLPACILERPTDPACQVSQDVPSVNDPSTKSVRATVDPAASLGQGMQTMAVSGGGGPMVLAASDGGSGVGGSYKATSLAPSGSWTAGGSGGGFSWTYPLTVPAPPAGPAPKIAFSYSSQAVDGKTSVANSQASWIGDGWDYEPGFIERRYRSCADDLEAKPAGAANNNTTVDKKKGDLCWAGDNVVMSFGGSTTELVHDSATGKWIPASDDGSRVEHMTDANQVNGARGGEYWIVTTRDGSRYFFGRHDVDGPGSRPVTNSVLTVPVFGNHPDEPCYKAANFTDSSCGTQQTGWRWNLDYVEDVHGNAMIIDWAKEDGRYAKNEKFKEAVTYNRAGYPTQITYGLRKENLSGTPSAKVEFSVDERCLEETKCTPTQFESKNYEDKQYWWDTPSTLHCKAGADCYIGSPTFWTRKRLTAVTTSAQRTEGSTALSFVDRWSLAHSFLEQRTDTSPPLWLESILRTGYSTARDSQDKQLTKSLPPVSFLPNGTDMPNRVANPPGADGKKDAAPDFDRLRVETIRTETGGEIRVAYSAPCAIEAPRPQPAANTSRCYPVHWSPDTGLENPPLAWFNKYVVESITEKDRVARQPEIVTRYEYQGDAAWAKDTDEFSKPKMRTYNQWRGYASVVTRRGDPTTGGYEAIEQSETKTRYFRGMSGDAGRPKITVKDSTGAIDLGEDLAPYQGTAAETTTYTKAGVGSSPVSRVLTWPWHKPSGSRLRADNTPLTAYRTGTSRTDKIQWVSGGSTRTHRIRNTFDKTHDANFDDSYGLIQAVQSEMAVPNGTGETITDQTCASTTYVHNTTAHLIGLVNSVRTTAGDCAAKATGQLLSETRTSYDALNAFGSAPSKGLAYQVDTNDAAGTGWITTARSEYDTLGRSVKVLDAAGNPVTTAYSPPTGPAFSVTTTNALGHTATVKSDPGRGQPLEDTDANGRKVTTSYDALGRATDIWTPSQKPGIDKAAHTFSYQITEHEPPVVTSANLEDDGTYTQTIAIYDGLLRPRQGQSEALGGGRLITDTLYNANGTVRRTNNNYRADGKPDKNIFVPDSQTAVLNSTRIAYDGLGRPVQTTTFHGTDAKDSTTTQYAGDWTLSRTGMSADGTTPLKGSRAVKTTTDVLGRTSKVEHYTTTNLGVSNPASNKTSYTYDLRNKLSKVTDAVGNAWTYAYDARGRMTVAEDPDMGKSTFTYNDLDQQVSATNAANQTQYTKYDALGRPTELRDDHATTGPRVATWTYDTLLGAKGQPVASTRWIGSDAFISEITGYDSEYRPTGSKITIPNTAATTGLAGTYAYSTTYTPTGKVQSTTVPQTPGGLAAEKLITRYNADGMPQTLSGQSWYTAETVYSPYGEVLRTASGSAPNRVWTTTAVNPNTGRVTETQRHRETAPNLLSRTVYSYDSVGNPTSISEARPGSTPQSPLLVDRQCFTYDAMGQLTKAWTGETDACTEPTDLAPTHATAGPEGDGYWQEYQFDAIGNRTQLLDKDPATGSVREKTTYAYGVDMGGGVIKKPHALVSATKTTTKPGSIVNSLSTYAYDQNGNTKTRRIGGDTQDLIWDARNKLTSATSPGIGAVAVTGLAGKCLDVETGTSPDDAAVQVLTCNESKPQQWRLTGDTVQALGKCLTAIGGETRLKPCDGTAQQKFTHRTDKTLYNTATGQCVTVPNDNATDGNDLDIYTCHGTPAQQWNFSNTTKYIYDASGNRLLEETGSSRTLYLGEAEITVNTAGQAIDAVRYYNSPGAPTTVRRTNGKTTGHSLSVLLTDHHNTATTTVEQTTNQPVTRRKSDPYGNPRGTQPTNWPGSRTFLGTGNDDNTTNLTHIGAREYEPTTGRFISVDPIIDITDPLQMNGYTYSHANPITNSDPTGLKDDNCAYDQRCKANGGPVVEQGSWNYVPTPDPPKGNGGDNKPKKCGFFSKCNLNKKLKAGKEFWNEHKVAIVSIATEIVVGAACVGTAVGAGLVTGGAGMALVVGCGAIAGAAGAAAANWMNKDADHSTTGILKDMGMGAAWGAAGAAAGGAAAPAIKAVGKAVGGAIGKGVNKYLTKTSPKGGASGTLSDSGAATSGGATRTNAPYRGDGETVLHGHGSWRPENGTTVVPEGTSLAFYGEHGFTISRQLGMLISGPGGPGRKAVQIAGPNTEIPNYTLAPLGPGFTFRNGSTVVEERTLLSDLLKPNMGNVHWAACRGCRNPR